ncbi:MAG TPA: hypothetical protein VIJ96_06735 [Acidothermaceae bacterium]
MLTRPDELSDLDVIEALRIGWALEPPGSSTTSHLWLHGFMEPTTTLQTLDTNGRTCNTAACSANSRPIASTRRHHQVE